MKSRRTLVIMPPLLLALASLGLIAAERSEHDTRRAAQWKTLEIIHALSLPQGGTVADIGAGDGFMTPDLAAAVGASGRVVAVDLDQGALSRLEEKARSLGFANVKTVHSTEKDPSLPAASIDGVVIIRAYHEFTYHGQMLAKLRDALKPGARIAIADVEPSPGNENQSREWQVGKHVMTSGIVENDLTAAGFRIVKTTDPFARLNNGETVWLVTAERPR